MDAIIALVLDPMAWVALATLIVLEVVLGIDNLIFIAIVTNKLPKEYQAKVRRVGISMALILRLVLLSTLTVIIALTDPVLSLFDNDFSWRDLILISGGLFLVWKATKEIHQKVDPLEQAEVNGTGEVVKTGFVAAVVQILLLDFIFSIDSIVTAVGMTPHLPIMFAAVIVAVGVMFWAADPLSRFIDANPSIVMLALGFLLMIGMTLIAEGFGVHVPKGYVYTAMGFSALVEGLNILSRRRVQSGEKL